MSATVIKTKKKCCRSNPRCKKCPVVMHRLDKLGQVQRTGKRTYVVIDISKKSLKAARAR